MLMLTKNENETTDIMYVCCMYGLCVCHTWYVASKWELEAWRRGYTAGDASLLQEHAFTSRAHGSFKHNTSPSTERGIPAALAITH